MKTKKTWTRSNGSKIDVRKMNEYHLLNAIKMTERKLNILLNEHFKLHDRVYRPLIQEAARRKMKV